MLDLHLSSKYFSSMTSNFKSSTTIGIVYKYETLYLTFLFHFFFFSFFFFFFVCCAVFVLRFPNVLLFALNNQSYRTYQFGRFVRKIHTLGFLSREANVILFTS